MKKTSITAKSSFFALLFISGIFGFAEAASAALPPLYVTCYASPSLVQAGQTVTFYATVQNGSGNYSYAWSGNCSGSSNSCSVSFSNSGTYNTTVSVYSYGPYGMQTGAGNCSVQVSGSGNYNCSWHASKQCVGNSVYWYDSCGNRQDFIESCPDGCINGYCSGNYNNGSNYLSCYNNKLYWFNSYHQPQSVYQDCGTGYCTAFGPEYCSGAGIFHDRTCYIKGCSFNSCQSTSYTDTQLVKACGVNQACSAGQCVSVQPQYIKNYKKMCYQDSIYWYDSNNAIGDVFKTCSDSNECTKDSCSGGSCTNTLKCDGSTCAQNSSAYKTYCSNSGQNGQNNGGQNNQNGEGQGILVSVFGAEEAEQLQWVKTVNLSVNEKIYFLAVVKNDTSGNLQNVNLKIELPGEIAYTGNLRSDGEQISGDIIAGVSIGSISAGASKTITFEGKVQSGTVSGNKEVKATASADNISNSDTFNVSFSSEGGGTAAVSGPFAWIMNFFKRWYLWLLIGIVMIFLFVVVFRRLSSE